MWLRRKPSTPAAPPLQVTLAELIALQGPARALALPARRRVATERAGTQLSRHKGRGMDFDETRAYQPGDDIRLMDWRVTARSGKPHTKVFHPERERPVFLCIDQGPHMHFGTRGTFKSILAAKAAALLAWAAMHNGDRVGAVVFSGQTHVELPPRGRQQGVLPLLNLLTQTSQAQSGLVADEEDFERALQRLRHVVRPGARVFLLSDFSHCSEKIKPQLAGLAQHTQMSACFISDPLERLAPPPDHYLVSDGLNHRALLDTTAADFRARYHAHFEQRASQLKALFCSLGIPLLPLSTDESVITALRDV